MKSDIFDSLFIGDLVRRFTPSPVPNAAKKINSPKPGVSMPINPLDDTPYEINPQ
jgi:hypothetical protein